MTTTIAKLQIGQRFSFIPAEWYGPAKLTVKYPYNDYDSPNSFTIKFDAAVINPPGVIYGIPGKTRVRLLKSRGE